MIKSRCHKAPVSVYCGNEGTSFYVCSQCDHACDTIFDGRYQGEHHDAGSEAEIERTFSRA